MIGLGGKTLFVSGGSRGIGLAIAAARGARRRQRRDRGQDGEPNPKLPGTIHSAAAEIEQAGGRALPVVCDIRDESSVRAAVDAAVRHFGGIDILLNNASAISLTGTLDTPMKRFDLMFGVNVRGTYLCSQACLPHLSGRPASAATRTSSRSRRRSTSTRSGSAITSPTRWPSTA